MMNLPQFSAEASLGPTMGIYRGNVVSARCLSGGSGIMPQLRFQPEGAACYWQCRGNGGGDLICRFFCGLAPFTIDGLLIGE
jgi:hypothetical protein